MKYTESCSVAGKDCNCPPAGKFGNKIIHFDYSKVPLENLGARLICFKCGQPVCENCSARYDYENYGRQTICDDCAEEEELEKAEAKILFKS